DLVQDFGVGFERAIAVREAGWYVDLFPVFGADNDRRVPSEGWRSSTDIDRDIENAAARAADQFGLGRLADLKMHAADRASGCRQGVVFLHEGDVYAASRHGVLAPDLREKSTGIRNASGRDDTNSRQPVDGEDIDCSHERGSCCSASRTRY